MGKRLLPGTKICSRSPPMADRRCRHKLHEVVRRHEECRTAFRKLRSQIQSGLMEAGDVFNSLSIPLMKLVGLKAEEMAADGKSTTIIINPEPQTHLSPIPHKSNGSARGPAVSGGARCSSNKEGIGFAQEHAVSGDLLHKLEEEVTSYSARADAACEEIRERQRLHAQRLVCLLRGIGVHLNTSQESIHRALDSTRGSFCHFIKRAASVVASAQPPARADQDALLRLVARVLQAAYKHVSSALEDVEEEADSLLRSLAEATCAPMVSHIRELRADAEGGAPAARLSALVGEMEAILGELRVETAMARKRARVAEEEMAEAVRVCQEMQAALMGGAIAGTRNGQVRRTPFRGSPKLADCMTNRSHGINGRMTLITSPSSSRNQGSDKMCREVVVTRARRARQPVSYM